MLTFTSVFALVFINAYRPFNVNQLYPDVDGIVIFGISSLLILLGLVVVGLSRWLLYHYSRKHVITYLGFGIWVISEIAALSCVYVWLSFLYLKNPGDQIYPVLLNTFRNTALVITIPYAFSILILSLKDYSEKLKNVDELRLSGIEADLPSVLSFYDSKGDMRFSIKRENLLYIEAADNYVNIWYTNKNSIEHYLLRATLKSIENLGLKGNIRRCHRSFMVNFDNVSIIKREKDGSVFAVFSVENVANIPISSTYADVITQSFIK